jgi:cell division protease FtsH
MMGMETVHNAYLGGDATLTCSETTLAKVDVKVMEIIKEAHQKALAILREHRDDLDRLANYLLEKETITGVEFMAILNNEDPAEAVRRAAEDAEARNAEQRVKDEEKARREAEELAAKQAQWTAVSAAAGMASGALGTEAKDGTVQDNPPTQEKTIAEVDAELREAIRKAEADPEEAEREARTVQENSGLTDAEFRSADEENKKA